MLPRFTVRTASPSSSPSSGTPPEGGLSLQAEVIQRRREETRRIMAMLKLEELIWDRWGPQEDALHVDGLWGLHITLPGFNVVQRGS
jgi:hypothetical protein